MKRAILSLTGLFFVLLLTSCGPTKTSIAVDLTDFAFAPQSWSIPAGSIVTITLNNKGTLTHEWVLIKKGEKVTVPFDADDEPKVFWEGEAEAGKTETYTFTAPTEGISLGL